MVCSCGHLLHKNGVEYCRYAYVTLLSCGLIITKFLIKFSQENKTFISK